MKKIKIKLDAMYAQVFMECLEAIINSFRHDEMDAPEYYIQQIAETAFSEIYSEFCMKGIGVKKITVSQALIFYMYSIGIEFPSFKGVVFKDVLRQLEHQLFVSGNFVLPVNAASHE